MMKPRKTAGELEASIRVEMEDICEWPTDMAISVHPDGDSWRVEVMQDSPGDPRQREMIFLIAERLRCEFDLKC